MSQALVDDDVWRRIEPRGSGRPLGDRHARHSLTFGDVPLSSHSIGQKGTVCIGTQPVIPAM